VEARRREPAKGVFRLTLPLPFPGMEFVNAYLLTDRGGSIVVDCGIHDPSDERAHGWDDVVAALRACDVDPSTVAKLVVTHPHMDHYGMAARMVQETGCELWMHKDASVDLDIYRDPESAIERLRALLSQHGVEGRELDELTSYEDWRPFVSGVVEDRWLSGDETFEASGRTWRVVHTPGHARSHICLWSESDHMLISGDHLLPTITPHIDFKRGDDDPLGDYLESLRKTEELDPNLVLPGHGRPFDEGAARARAIAAHHERRLGSILQVIRQHPHSADEITDAIFGATLLHFQRRLALGETLAHLVYLARRGEIERSHRDDGTYEYRKASSRKERGS
jgi:glyoxylase-like metal-dependent hydrolase (beta-lactamase superfamily II)